MNTADLMHSIASGQKLKNVDFGKAFETLKEDLDDRHEIKLLTGLKQANNKSKEGNFDSYAEAFGMLTGTVTSYLVGKYGIAFKDLDEMLAYKSQGEGQ